MARYDPPRSHQQSQGAKKNAFDAIVKCLTEYPVARKCTPRVTAHALWPKTTVRREPTKGGRKIISSHCNHSVTLGSNK
ncbi:hypothetical protein NDU88_004406 [Pleurodeles waltl]|uniref:Uncharacterized protein n=1 Tax=Pleurodeles waltl TaxID=8319 RepID=A0AAV7PCF1_PLEWA|nr:hypothetical protein NDU88_004406 [Pleurodeles waltl]